VIKVLKKIQYTLFSLTFVLLLLLSIQFSLLPVKADSRKIPLRIYRDEYGNYYFITRSNDTVYLTPLPRLTRWKTCYSEINLTNFLTRIGGAKSVIFDETENKLYIQIKFLGQVYIEIVMYPLNITEYGGLEIEIRIYKPIVLNIIGNKLRFPFPIHNLKAYYQPPLYIDYGFTEPYQNGTFFVNATHAMRLIKDVWRVIDYRPENAVGSYAVYHVSKRNGIYKTGKAFHIFRPKAYDANGNEAWCNLNITDKFLIVEVPQTFIEKATYPIIIDPYFGYNSAGISSQDIGDSIHGSKFLCLDVANAENISAYLERDGYTQTEYAKCAIYKHDDSSLVGYTSQLSITTAKWYKFNVISGGSLSANTEYVLVAWAECQEATKDPYYTSALLHYDDGETNQGHYQDKTYDGFPDPASFSHNDRKYSIYCEYSPANNPPNPPSLDSPSDNEHFDISSTVTFTWTFSDPDGDTQSAYEFELDDNSDFSSPIIDTGKVSSSTSSITQTLPNTVGLYYWRVRVWDTNDAVSDWSISRTIIADRVQITLSVSDNHIDVGSSMSWSFTAIYEYDSSDATSYVTVNLNDTTTKNTVGLWFFTVSSISESQYGLSVFTSNVISCIWDKVQFTLSVDDTRINVGETASISVSGVYAYDNSAFSGTYSLNDTLSKDTVGKYYYTISSITDDNYGLTVFESNVVYVIFDRIIVTLSTSDSRIDVGSTGSYSYTAIYEYDSVDATSYVTITLNDTLTKDVIGKYDYTVSSISESQYGLTAFSSNSFSIIFDKVQVTLSVADNRINVGDNATIIVNAIYEYDGSNLIGSVTLNDTQTVKNTVGIYWFTVSSITDNQYGLTSFTSNKVYVIYDRIDVDNFQFSDSSMFNVTFRCLSEYDGILSDRNFQVKLYINNTLQNVYSVSSNTSGYITLTSTVNLHGYGNISFYIIWTDENIKSYEKTRYTFNYYVSASIYDMSDLLSSYTPSKSINLEVTFLPNCTIYNASNVIQKWTLKLKNLYWKAYIYEATQPPQLYSQTPYSPSSWIFTSKTSCQYEIWTGDMYPPYKSGSYFIELELWIKGSDYFLDSVNSTIFSVEVTSGVSGTSGSSSVTQETVTLFIKVVDFYNKEIEGAIVEIKDIYNVTIYNETTDVWGAVTISLPRGNYTIIVSYNNVTEIRHIYIEEPQHLEFKLNTLSVVPSTKEVVVETQTLIFLVIAVASVIVAVYFERRNQYYIAVPIAGVTMFSIFYTLAVSLRLVKPFIVIPFNIAFPKISLPSFMTNISILNNTTILFVFSSLIVGFAIIFVAYKYSSRHKKRTVKRRIRKMYVRGVRI